jgi:serine/threonine protein kinase
MNERGPCPVRVILEGFVLNWLSPEQSREFEHHLLHCEVCLTELEAACDLNSVVNALHHPPSQDENQEEPVVSELIERGRRLHMQRTPTTPDQAVIGSAATPPAAARGDDKATTVTPANRGEEVQVLAPPQQPDEIGRLGPYRVLKLLGQGGMGAVYLAEDPDLGRRVALKTLRSSLAAEPKARERFLREARAAAALEHDHIVPIFHVSVEQGVPFLAMPLLKGESLETRLKTEQKLPPAEAIRIAREAAEGLACAHAAGLIHRDIKPDNLWLEARTSPLSPGGKGVGGEGGRVKLLDFGLARPVEPGNGLTETGALVGTPGYMAPELAGGAPLDGRADLFGLGVVLYRMLTGKAPYRGGSMLRYIESLLAEPPPPPAAVESTVPEALSNLVMRLLERDPADRPASAAALVAELAALELTLEAPPAKVVSQAPSASAGTPEARSVSDRTPQGVKDGSQGQRTGKRRRWAVAAAVMLPGRDRPRMVGCTFTVVAAVVMLGLTLSFSRKDSRRGGDPPPPTSPPVTTAPPATNQVLAIDVEHFTSDGESCGLLGVDSFVAHLKDYVKVKGRLSRGAPAYLIAFTPDGEEELLYPDEDIPPRAEEAPRYPWRTEDRGKSFSLEEGEGLQVFVVVVLRRPLPYREWKAQRAKGPWKKQPTPPDVVWWDNGTDIERLTMDDRKKGKDVPGAGPIVALSEWLKKAPEVETVAALGFAVVGKKGR